MTTETKAARMCSEKEQSNTVENYNMPVHDCNPDQNKSPDQDNNPGKDDSTDYSRYDTLHEEWGNKNPENGIGKYLTTMNREMFYSISAEGVHDYFKRAAHPVHIGELYHQRYRIMMKIGHGSYSTVWLAVDCRNSGRHVALKFLHTGEQTELQIHEQLRASIQNGENEGNQEFKGQKYMMPLLDSFQIGLEIKYTVLVTEVLIPFRDLNEDQRLQLNIKKLLFQLIQGLSFLHSQGITHGDLHPGNIALRLPRNRQRGFGCLNGFEQPKIVLVVPNRGSDVGTFLGYPKYLVSRGTFKEYIEQETKCVTMLSSARIQIIDLSNSYLDPPSPLPGMHCYVRGPEFAANKLNQGETSDVGGFHSDVWSVAVTMYALVFRSSIGSWPTLFENLGGAPCSVLGEVERKIGPLPEAWRFPEKAREREEDGEDEEYLGYDPTGDYRLKDKTITPEKYWEGLLQAYEGPWYQEEIRGFLRLLRRMLIVDPALRPSMDSVVMDKWFDDVRGQE